MKIKRIIMAMMKLRNIPLPNYIQEMNDENSKVLDE